MVEDQQQHLLALAQSKKMSPQRDLAAEINALTCRSVESFGQSRFGNRHHAQRGPRVSRFQDELMRSAFDYKKEGAQAFVALDQIV